MIDFWMNKSFTIYKLICLFRSLIRLDKKKKKRNWNIHNIEFDKLNNIFVKWWDVFSKLHKMLWENINEYMYTYIKRFYLSNTIIF